MKMNNIQKIIVGLLFLVVSGTVIFVCVKMDEKDNTKERFSSETNKEEIDKEEVPPTDQEKNQNSNELVKEESSQKESQEVSSPINEEIPNNQNKEQQQPTKVEDIELIVAKQVKATTSRIEISKGEAKKFNLVVSGSAGLVEVKPKNSNIIKVSTSSTDCNGLKCFFDSLTGNNHSIEFTVSGTVAGETAIDIEIIDLVTLEGNQVTGINSINVLVK